MNINKLTLRSIQDLLGESFFVPSYQRGYRWKENQVKALLNDIWDFVINPPKKEWGDVEPFYCLQPIVVKPNEDGCWEVIDGQQRLTTIFLILNNLEQFIDGQHKNFASIDYETRRESGSYLNDIQKEFKDSNVDYYHIYEANETIKKWFSDMGNFYASARIKFLTPFLENTKVIWYEVNDDSDAIDIFTRINMGKIPLTNSELIRALFLRKDCTIKGNPEQFRAKQFRIASEWDRIENTLQDDSFWYFIFGGKESYVTRIEYIFDLMKGKTKDSEEFFTFNEFHKDFTNDGRSDVHWKVIKDYFMLFEQWYIDRDLYHLIGFLISSGDKIPDLKKLSEGKTKTEFKDSLRILAKKHVKVTVRELEYPDPEIKSVLLLFNIQTILKNPNSSFRFPFDKFKKETWDIEHIRSVKSDRPASNTQRNWLEVVLEYFTGSKKSEDQLLIIEGLPEAENVLARMIYDELAKEKISTDRFAVIYEEILKEFKEEDEPEDINLIQNLTLLDAATNRGYKNSVFPIKRRTIISNDMNTSFVPVCTKNVFSKSYSNKLDNVMFWGKSDAADYLKQIEDTLNPFLPDQMIAHGND